MLSAVLTMPVNRTHAADGGAFVWKNEDPNKTRQTANDIVAAVCCPRLAHKKADARITRSDDAKK